MYSDDQRFVRQPRGYLLKQLTPPTDKPAVAYKNTTAHASRMSINVEYETNITVPLSKDQIEIET